MNNPLTPFVLLNTVASTYRPQEPGACYEGDTFVADLSARDPEGDTVTYQVVSGSLPRGFSLDPATGIITGVGSLFSFGGVEDFHDFTWVFEVGASDGLNNYVADPQTFSITVKAVEHPPQWGAGVGGTLFQMYEGDSISNATIVNASGAQIVSTGVQLLGATDPVGLPITYGVADPNDLPQGIVLNAQGIFTGQLPPVSANYIPNQGTVFSFTVVATNSEGLTANLPCSIQVLNVPGAVTWASPAAGDLGTIGDSSSSTFTFVATDTDDSPITYTVKTGAIPTGMSLASATGILSGTPTLTPGGGTNAPTTWYLADGGGESLTPADSSYVVTNDQGDVVFRTKGANDSPFVTDNNDLTSTGGQTYKISYVIRLAVAGTNGIKSYVKPAFDGFDSAGNLTGNAFGTRSGPGFISDPNNVGEDFFDSSVWGVGNWVTLNATYTNPNPSPYANIRGRIRLNRAAVATSGPPYGTGIPSRADGPPFSDDIYEVKSSVISTASTQFTFTITASNGFSEADRTFTIEVQNTQLPPVWDTPAGSLGTFASGASINVQTNAHSPQGSAITFGLAGGTLPPGVTYFAQGLLSGTAPTVTSDTTYTFDAVAVDSTGLQTPQTFSFVVSAQVHQNQLPVWDTPAGSIGSGFPGNAFSFQLQAHDPDNGPSPLTYAVVGGMPVGLSVSSSGLVSGTLPGAGSYNFTIAVSDGVAQVNNSFSISVGVVPSGSIEYTALGQNPNFTIPGGITQVTFIWLIGGGGGGGAGTEFGNGGGGGGGGSGGYYNMQVIPVTAGDVISVFIGGAGVAQFPSDNASGSSTQFDGTAGGSSNVYKNGQLVLSAGGGAGGQGCPNTTATFIAANGGAGGTPGGTAGDNGQVGTNDHATTAGANGKAGPIPGSAGGGAGQGFGGANPYGTSAGGDGLGYGSSGGGAGNQDRAGINWWCGGNGIQGYALMAYGGATASVTLPLPGGGVAGGRGGNAGNPVPASGTSGGGSGGAGAGTD